VGTNLEPYSLIDRVRLFFPAGIVADREMLNAHLGERERAFLGRLADLMAESHVTIAEHPATRLMEVQFDAVGYEEARTVTLPWWPDKLDGWRLKETLEAQLDDSSDDPLSYQTLVKNNKSFLEPQIGPRERLFLLALASLLEEEQVTIAENGRSRLIEISFKEHGDDGESLVTLPDWPRKLDPWKLKALLNASSPYGGTPASGGPDNNAAHGLPQTHDELQTYYWGFGYGLNGQHSTPGTGPEPSVGDLVRLLKKASAPLGPLHRRALARVGASLMAGGIKRRSQWEPALIIELAGASGSSTRATREILCRDDQEGFDRVIDRIYKDACKLYEEDEQTPPGRSGGPSGIEPTLGDQLL
jgi:hypothetical protein